MLKWKKMVQADTVIANLDKILATKPQDVINGYYIVEFITINDVPPVFIVGDKRFQASEWEYDENEVAIITELLPILKEN